MHYCFIVFVLLSLSKNVKRPYLKKGRCPYFNKANKLLTDVLHLKIEGCIAHQNLLEFLSVITNPKQVENPLSIDKAYLWGKIYLNSVNLKKIYPLKDTLSKTINKAREQSISKTEIFDCYLVSTMEDNNVFTLYTDNTTHFQKYKNINVLNPF